MPSPFIVNFNHVDRDDIALVGGKGANLGEMTKAGFPVPPGFIVTSNAYYEFVDANKLRTKIRVLLSGLDVGNTRQLTSASQQIRKLINASPLPDRLAKHIMTSYLALGSHALVAVRSSATAEDLPDASFAGQQDTFLNVSGEANVVDRVRDAWSSLFTPRAIFYREQKKFDHFKVGIAIPIQRMIQSDVSGVMFTMNPVTNDKSQIVIEAIWGLGELIVQGTVTPDHYEVLRRTMLITKKQVERQTKMMRRRIRDHRVDNEITKVPPSRQQTQKLPDALIVTLATLGASIHQHYFFPQDIEWAIEKGRIFIIQTRPITTIAAIAAKGIPGSAATKGMDRLLRGEPASPGLVSGPVRVIRSIKEIHNVRAGDILVMTMTSPDFVPALKKVVAVVTDEGGLTSHAAIVSRELGVTCVVGTEKATRVLKTGTVVTVNGVTGEVFRGGMKQAASTMTSEPLATEMTPLRTATKLYVNLAEPELAEKIAAENVDGVGLLRAEFIMAQIGTHPKLAIEKKQSRAFIDQLTEKLLEFASAFYPRPVMYRASDFRTNEYRNLKGGDRFEPHEENPMLGFRGAFRYIKNPDAFELELVAISNVRTTRNNLHLMIPFVRTVNELKEVKKLVVTSGLRRSSSFHLFMMAELPVNVIQIDDFIDVGIDGISIGSNDLTMLILGTDRDNQTVASEYDEQHPAVMWSLKRLITASVKRNIQVSICGQAPSVYPELTEKLIEWGISAISVSPDRIGETRRLMYEAEKKLVKRS